MLRLSFDLAPAAIELCARRRNRRAMLSFAVRPHGSHIELGAALTIDDSPQMPCTTTRWHTPCKKARAKEGPV